MRHGKEKAEQLEKRNQHQQNELHLYYTYRDDKLLDMNNIERIKRQKQLEARQEIDELAGEAAKRRRIQEQKRQEKIEARRLAAEKRRQESDENSSRRHQ